MTPPPRNVFEWSKAYFRSGDHAETTPTMAALMTYADFSDLTCYPSQQTLARATGLSVDTVRRHIRTNVKAGWLAIVEPGSSYKSATKYRLTTPSTGAGRSVPAPRTDAARPLAPMQSTPSTDARSTPSTGAALTTHVTSHGSTHGSIHGSTQDLEDPLEGPLGGGPEGDNLPPIATNHVPTPSTDARSWGGTDAHTTRWPRDKPFPTERADLDPFTTYVDAQTGEAFETPKPGKLPTLRASAE